MKTATGDVVWTYDTSIDGPQAEFHGEPLVTEKLVVVGSDAQPTGYVYAFDRPTGAVVWKSGFPGGVPATILHRGGDVFVVSASGQAAALELDTGRAKWSYRDAPKGAEGRVPPDPVLLDDRLIVGWRTGEVDAIDPMGGRLLWRSQLGSPLNTSLIADRSGIVVGTIDGRWHRLDPQDGRTLARLEINGMPYGDLVRAESCVLALWSDRPAGSDRKHHLGCLDPSLGAVVWSQSSPTEWTTFHPLVWRSQVVAGVAGRLMAFDIGSGANEWACRVEGTPRGLTGSADRLFLGTLKGVVLALDRAACAREKPGGDAPSGDGF